MPLSLLWTEMHDVNFAIDISISFSFSPGYIFRLVFLWTVFNSLEELWKSYSSCCEHAMLCTLSDQVSTYKIGKPLI